MNKYNIEKVANAIKFFEMKSVRHLGKTKLMKLLFFADKAHLEQFCKPIFYDKYFKLPHGPVPSLTLNIIDSLNECENDDLHEYTLKFKKHINVKEQEWGKGKRTKFEAVTDFEEDLFSKSELDIMEVIAKQFQDETAKKISDISHKLPEYQFTEMNEIIDYSDMAPEHNGYLKYIANTNREFEEIFR